MKRSLKQVMAKLLKNEPRTGRKHWRDQFELISRYWQPLTVLDMGNGIVRLMRNDGGYDELNLRALRTEMPIEHYIVVRTLLRLLDEQAQSAACAVAVAKEALGIQARRTTGGKKTAKSRTKERDKRIDKLRNERAKLLAGDSWMKKEAVAAILADRGFGGKVAIEKLLRAKKSLEGH